MITYHAANRDIKENGDEQVKGILSLDIMRRYKALYLTKDIAISGWAKESVEYSGS